MTTITVMVALHVAAVVGLVLLALGRVPWPTVVLAVALYAATGVSIAAGYHRLFSHRAYRASPPVRWFLLAFGAAAFQNSALAWSADHRDHHADTDGPGDPYSVTRGLWWAHMGWMFRSRPGLGRARAAPEGPGEVPQHPVAAPLVRRWSPSASACCCPTPRGLDLGRPAGAGCSWPARCGPSSCCRARSA